MRINIRVKGFEPTDSLRDQVERRIRLALTRFADRLDGVTVRIEQRVVRVEGDTRYSCEVAVASVHVEILEEHDRLETALDRAIDRATRVAAHLVIPTRAGPSALEREGRNTRETTMRTMMSNVRRPRHH